MTGRHKIAILCMYSTNRVWNKTGKCLGCINRITGWGCGGKVGFEIGGKTEKCLWCIVRKGVEVVTRDSATTPNGESIS